MKRVKFGRDIEALTDLYRRGMPKGDSSGWKCVDGLYTVSPHQLTVVTGIPNHGKSEWVDALLCNLLTMQSEKPWRVLVCSPENWPTAFHEAKILEKWIGKRFGAGYHNRMTEEEMRSVAIQEISERFEFLELEDGDNFATVLTAAHEFCARNQKYQCGVVLDPWNQLEHCRPQHLSETEYVSDALSAAIRITRKTGAHMWIVAHPAKIQKDRDTGIRPVPTPYDISGSAHWYNKCDNCITIYRNVMATPEDRDWGVVQVHVQKVRFKHTGKPGSCELHYDIGTGRYHEERQMPIRQKLRKVEAVEL